VKPERDTQQRSWRNNLLFTAGVMITVLLAMILAQLDSLQARAVAELPGLPIVNIQATAIAVGNIIPLDLDSAGPITSEMLVNPAPNDLNPRPEFITGVSDGVIFTVCGEVPEGWLLYTVQPGETFGSLAAATESTVADLAAANCVGDDHLVAGMQILVPRQPAVSLCGPPQWWVRYQVMPGDTIGALAVNRRTTIDEVLRANCRDTTDLQSGQWIFLPPGYQPNVGVPVQQPSLTPLPTSTVAPTSAPLPTAPIDSEPPPPTPTVPVVASPVPPTASPPPLPTVALPSLTPQPPPTNPPPSATPAPPTEPPPSVTLPPPTAAPPTSTPAPPPTDPPPTSPPATEPSPGEGG